jgi:class 3 adenylate cyclase/tetratricopeptide (TPR) repeat protein
MTATSAEREASVDLAVYAPRIATAWLRAHPERRWFAPTGTVVFADVTGFTPMTEKLSKRGKVGAEELTDILNDIFGRLLSVAGVHGGDLLKFGGDALLLFFTGNEHVERACAAACAMQSALRPFRRFRSEAGPLSLTMSVGIATGSCHLFLVGDSHRELMVSGPVFSRAVELERDAGSGDVLLSDDVAALLPSESVGQPLGSGWLLSQAPKQTPLPHDVALVLDAMVDDAILVPLALREHLKIRRNEGEHRVAVLTFLQFAGTDRLLRQLGPDAVAAALDELIRTVQHACETHQVAFLATDIDRDGGKILLCAGAPRATPRSEDATLHALQEILARPHTLRVRAGVHVGRAFAVDVGSPSRRTFAVMGDATNLAARVMGKAAPGQVVATRAITERLHASFALQPLEPFRVKGKSELVHASVVGQSLLVDGSGPSTAKVPLVGRAAELGLLLAAVDDARAGRGRVIELIGEPGIGKSRLLAEVREQAPDLDLLVVEGSQYLAATPYLALRGPLHRLLGVAHDVGETGLRLALDEVVLSRAPHLAPLAPLIGLAFGVEMPDTDTTAVIGDAFRRDRLNDAVRELLQLLLPGPTLLLFDDTQWLDDASVGLMQHLLSRLTERPWALILARRPDAPTLATRATDQVTTLELGPLLPEAAHALVTAAAGGVPLRPHVRQALAERGAGNPLFLAELVRATISGGDPDALPDSIEATVAAAIDQVPAADRSHLRLAAVLGRRFALDLLQSMLGEERELEAPHAATDVVARLGRFLVQEEDEVRFSQGVVRDVAYEGLSFRRRRLLHGRAGDLLLAEGVDQREDLAELLSVHYSVAARHEECWRWARLAAERSRRAAAPVEAALHLRRALEAARHLGSAAPDVASTWESLGDVCVMIARHDEAKIAYATARRLCRDRRLELVELHIKEGRLRSKLGSLSAPLRWYSRGLKLLEDEPPSAARRRLEGQLLAAYAGSRLDQAKFKQGLPLLERAVELASVLPDRETMAYAYYLLEWGYSELGLPGAEAYGALSLALFDGLGDGQGQFRVLNSQGASAYYAGRWAEALDLYERAYRACERSGDIVKTQICSHNIAEVLSDQGLLEEAEPRFHEALSTFRATDYAFGIAQTTSDLARMLVRGGRGEEAAPAYAEARRQFKSIGADALVLETDAREAERLVYVGLPAAGLALVEETMERLGGGLGRAASAGGQGALIALLKRVAGYALTILGQPTEAISRLEQAVRAARDAGVKFELALSLDALAVVGAGAGAGAGISSTTVQVAAEEARDIFRRLDVVLVSRPPMIPGASPECVAAG